MTHFTSKNKKLKSDGIRIASRKIIQQQETMVLEVGSPGAFDVPNVQSTDVLRYTMRMVTVTDHPGSKAIQKLLEERRNSSQPGVKCLSHHEAQEQFLSTSAACCNSCRRLS